LGGNAVFAACDVFDVAVIGYGPTGVTAANLLGPTGLRVAVVERDAEVFSRARAISTDEEVMRIWQRVGLADRLARDMLAARPIDLVDVRGRSLFSARPPSRGHGHPPQQFLYQPAVEEVLRAGAARYPAVEVLSGHELLGLRQDPDGVDLTLAGPGGEGVRRLRASYVIAADGGSSTTRERLGVGYEGRTYADRWVVVDARVLEPWPGGDRLRWHCDPDRPVVDCPVPFGHHRWEFPLLPGEDERAVARHETGYALAARYGVGADRVKVLRVTVYKHHARCAARWRVGRVLLAGDAAHAMPPWTGQGMAAGVRDVANLCWKLDAVLRGRMPDTLLDSYEAERKPHVRKLTRQAVLAGRIIVQRRRPLTLLRDCVLRRLGRVPGFSGFLMDATWIPAARYTAGLRASARSRATGRLVPQPVVTRPDRTRARLDDVLGGRWLLLHAGTPASHPEWTRLGVPSLTLRPPGAPPAPGALVDEDGGLLAWMRRYRAATLALRPDGYVYAAASVGGRLPAPPPGLRVPGAPDAPESAQAPDVHPATERSQADGALRL